MSLLLKIGAWSVEITVEALSFFLVFVIMSHVSENITLRDVIAVTVEIVTFFVISGYAVSTLVIRFALRGKWVRVYPVIAPLLFLLHFEVMNLWVPGGLMEPHNRFVFRVAGSGVVFAVTSCISLVFQHFRSKRWSNPQVLSDI